MVVLLKYKAQCAFPWGKVAQGQPACRVNTTAQPEGKDKMAEIQTMKVPKGLHLVNVPHGASSKCVDSNLK